MDPAAFNPTKEVRENLIDATQELIDLWLESPEDKSRRAIERRLQRLVTGLPWLLGLLYPWEQDFLLWDLGLHPPSAFTFERLDAVSERDPLASPDSGTLFSGAILSATRDSTGSLPTFVVTDPSQVGVYKPSVTPKDCVSAAPSEPGLYCHFPAQFCVQPLASHQSQLPSPLGSLQPIFLSMAQSVAQLMAQSQSSLTPLQEAVPTLPILDCFSSSHPEQGDTLFHNGPVPQKLATLGTVTHSRASPEAGLQPAANSGPLEAKLPAKDCIQLSLPVPGQCSAQLQPSSCVPEAHMPAGFVTCVPEAPVPTGFEPVFAGGNEEPVQPLPSSAASAEGSQEPLQPAALAGGTEEPVQLSPSPAAPSPPAPPPAAPTPSPAAPPPASPTPSPAVPPPAAPTPGPASASASSMPGPALASASSTPGPALASASSTPGPASASASSTPGPASVSASSPGPASVSSPSPGPASASPASPAAASPASPAAASPASPAAASSSSSAAAASSASPGPASASDAASASSSSSYSPCTAAGTPPSGPHLAPQHHRPFSRPLAGYHRHRGRPPERGCRHHRLPRGRPPDFCRRQFSLSLDLFCHPHFVFCILNKPPLHLSKCCI
ncbi:tumor necrosis factor receptor superfamily member 1A [Sarotherodon galilaeus]